MNMKVCDSGQIFRPVLTSVSKNLFADYSKRLCSDNKVDQANPNPTRKRRSLEVTSLYGTNSPADSDDTSEDKLPLSSKRLKIMENEDEVNQMKMREVRSSIQAEFGSSLTAEQIKAHLSSLSSSNTASMECSSFDDRRVCQLCASGELMFASSPMYCSNCSGRIKDKGNYYSSQQYCFCSRCVNFTRSRGDIMVDDVRVLKAKLEKKKNLDNKQAEAWVQCGRCERWQHQICSLYSGLESNEDYVCLKCVLKEMEFKEMKKPKSIGFCAKDLPSTKLSDHIETRLLRRLKQERLERLSQMNEDDEVLVDGIVVREVLSVAKKVKVKQEYKELFPKESYPDEFPYRSKVILMFQKIDGVDVCIFGMYVQEFGAECSYPNKGCVYISYLDSVKYFRPEETRTVTGEALRTFVYHEILIGYIEFCKQRGFTTAYIWACPPSKEEDYILYCHPPMQRTPLPVKLRKWYQSMIKKATNAGIVVGCSNLYDKFFIPSGAGEKCHSKVTAASLPHFDGDFWSSCAEDLIKEMIMSNNKKEDKTTTIRKRTLEAMGHTNATNGSAKDVLLMQRLGEALLTNRENFLVVDLQYVCIHCHEAILSGEHWSCSRCKNFHLCEKCHKSFWGKEQQHELSKVIEVEDAHEIPDTTRNVEATLSNSLFEERPSFLNFCVKHHYQFDTLRHAKYSSLMILHQLRCLSAPKNSTDKNNISHTDDEDDQSWLDKQRSTAVSHVTKIGRKKKKTKGMMSPEVVKELLNVLKHSTLCYPTKNQPCSYYPNRNCFMIKKLFLHVKKCELRVARGCELCSKAWRLLILHSTECRVSKCAVPRCMDLKEHHRKTRAESEVSSKPASPSKSRWLPEVGISAKPYVMVPY